MAHYNVYRGTTAGFAVNTATDTPLAQPSTNSYSDSSGLVDSTTYYYKVAAVDTSANIGILSDESATSPAQYFTMYPFQVTRQAPLIQVHQSDLGRRHSMLHPY